MAVLIAKGTKVTCENGHHIATANKDIETGDKTKITDFDWLIDPPRDGAFMDETRCPVCDAPYVRSVGIGSGAVHTPDGWLP